MKEQLPRLHELIRVLQQVPYLASKNVYRVAHYFLEMSPDKLRKFMNTLEGACAETVRCDLCCAWKERTLLCAWCHAPRRNQHIICVVETWHDLCAIERTSGYTGVFHVLGGVISPLDGIGPDDLAIDKLVVRLRTLCSDEKIGQPPEIILAMNQTLEGEATAAFIVRMLGALREKVLITCLSRGIPVGSPLDVLDRITVGKAIAERRPF